MVTSWTYLLEKVVDPGLRAELRAAVDKVRAVSALYEGPHARDYR